MSTAMRAGRWLVLGESRAAAGIALAVFVLVWLPMIAFPRHPVPGHINDGVVSLGDDMPAYLSAIRQGMQGHVLFLDQFTTAPVGRILMFPLYTASGLLLRPLHWTPPQIFTLLRLLSDIGLLAALWLLTRTCLPSHRVAAYALCLLNAGGIGVALLLDPNPIPFLNGSFGLIQMLMLPPPHVAAGVACEVLAVALYLQSRRWYDYVALYAVLLLLGLVYPFGLPTLMATCGADALWRAAEQRRITTHLLAVLAGTAVVAVIPAYYWHLLHQAPIWSGSALLAVGTWPSLALLAWIYAPTLLLAVPSALRRVNRLLLLWPVTALACALAGGAQPVRMLAGLTVPLALLAVQTIARRPRLLGSSVLALGLGGMLLPFLFIVVVRANAGRIFMPVAISRIGAYLAPRTTEHDVILAGYDVSNLLVGLTPARVVAGHGSQTVDLQSSGPIVRGYFTWPRTRRIQVENRYGVTYVVVSLSQNAGLARNMAADARYARVYATADYAVFHRRTGVQGMPRVREQFVW